MNEEQAIILKKGKDRPIRNHHHWIFSGAVKHLPPPTSAPIVPVYSAEKDFLGLAALSHNRSIVAHMLTDGSRFIEPFLREKIRKAFALRQKLFDPNVTNAFRLINAEGDGIPGLIVDSYDRVLVMQIASAGIESIRDLIINLLKEECAPIGLLEKSTSFLRKKEGMEQIVTTHFGESHSSRLIRENGMVFSVDLVKGQKTGWFIDQREMRKMIHQFAENRSVLNLFAYTGGFSVAALLGHAKEVVSVDISERCIEQIGENLSLNQLPQEKHRAITADVFEYIQKESLDFDLIILDPPAFVKRREDIDRAYRAYKEINRHILSKMKPSSFLLTCSCSYHVSEELFQNILYRAALEANRNVRILSRHHFAPDHPVSIYHPESQYLKSLFLYVE